MKDKNEWELNPKATATMKHLLEQQPQKLPTADGEVLVYRVSPKFLATELSEISAPPHPTEYHLELPTEGGTFDDSNGNQTVV